MGLKFKSRYCNQNGFDNNQTDIHLLFEARVFEVIKNHMIFIYI